MTIRLTSTIRQVYERGVELFTFPISFEIWNTYLSKFVKRYVRYISSYSIISKLTATRTGWHQT